MKEHGQNKLNKVAENDLTRNKLHNVDDKDAYIADEYCPNLNHNFLELFESEIQNEFLKDEKLSEKDVEEVFTILTIIHV